MTEPISDETYLCPYCDSAENEPCEGTCPLARLNAAPAECERLRAALQEIIDWDSESRDIADAALAAPPDPREPSE